MSTMSAPFSGGLVLLCHAGRDSPALADRDALGFGITLLNRLILVGSPLAGQRARIRLDGQLMHVLTQDGCCGALCPAPFRRASGTGCKGCA